VSRIGGKLSFPHAKKDFSPRSKEHRSKEPPGRKNPLTRAAIEATLLSQSGEHELELAIAGTRVALASFNCHHWHFSTEFAFDADGPVVSGCAGFGPERWLAAMRQAGTLQ
jgi:hypothetical protein